MLHIIWECITRIGVDRILKVDKTSDADFGIWNWNSRKKLIFFRLRPRIFQLWYQESGLFNSRVWQRREKFRGILPRLNSYPSPTSGVLATSVHIRKSAIDFAVWPYRGSAFQIILNSVSKFNIKSLICLQYSNNYNSNRILKFSQLMIGIEQFPSLSCSPKYN